MHMYVSASAIFLQSMAALDNLTQFLTEPIPTICVCCSETQPHVMPVDSIYLSVGLRWPAAVTTNLTCRLVSAMHHRNGVILLIFLWEDWMRSGFGAFICDFLSNTATILCRKKCQQCFRRIIYPCLVCYFPLVSLQKRWTEGGCMMLVRAVTELHSLAS